MRTVLVAQNSSEKLLLVQKGLLPFHLAPVRLHAQILDAAHEHLALVRVAPHPAALLHHVLLLGRGQGLKRPPGLRVQIVDREV